MNSRFKVVDYARTYASRILVSSSERPAGLFVFGINICGKEAPRLALSSPRICSHLAQTAHRCACQKHSPLPGCYGPATAR